MVRCPRRCRIHPLALRPAPMSEWSRLPLQDRIYGVGKVDVGDDPRFDCCHWFLPIYRSDQLVGSGSGGIGNISQLFISLSDKIRDKVAGNGDYHPTASGGSGGSARPLISPQLFANAM